MDASYGTMSRLTQNLVSMTWVNSETGTSACLSFGDAEGNPTSKKPQMKTVDKIPPLNKMKTPARTSNVHWMTSKRYSEFSSTLRTNGPSNLAIKWNAC